MTGRETDDIPEEYFYQDPEASSCMFTAKLLLDICKEKNIAAKVYWLTGEFDGVSNTGHAYVVLNSQTRKHRIEVANSKLKAGSRRPCCFNTRECTVQEVSNRGVLLD